jgi:hypothetical protein
VKITIKVHRDEILEKKYLPVYLLIKKNRWSWQSVGAGMALGGGLLSPTLGIVLNLLYSYTRLGYERPALYKISMGFYMMTVPLLMLGAHFLDLLEKKAVELRATETNFVKQTIRPMELQTKAEECSKLGENNFNDLFIN